MKPVYVPGSLQELAAWFENFTTQFSIVAASLGFLPADVTEVQNDNQDVQFCATSTVEIAAFAKAFRQYRTTLLYGKIGDRTPAYPPNPVAIQPVVVPTGILERTDRLVTRIKIATAYTSEIGHLLGIIPVSPVRPVDPQPNLKISAMPGSVVAVKFVRGQMDGVTVEMKVDNAETWSDAGRFTSSPAALIIPQNADNLPRAVRVRARYFEKDAPVGQFSAVVSTATQPAD